MMLNLLSTMTKTQWYIHIGIYSVIFAIGGWCIYDDPQTWKKNREGKIQERLVQ